MINEISINQITLSKADIQTKNPEKGFYYYIVKRTADIIFSSVVLLLTAPIMLVLICLIRLESKGPAFYVQERVGENGKIFKVYKLRTMFIDNEKIGGGVRTLTDDPRITKIGRLIRSSSLDEFPQFYNILKGEMSYVGPRPISKEEHQFVLSYLKKNNQQIPQGFIHKVKPGITGWALLHGREKISYENRFKLNAQYENNLNMWFDIKIFFLTFKKYLFTNLVVLALFLMIAGFTAVKVI
jgi:undecaprenyl phosphate N,N'-diacetylbacillosamine 1-phosphate transferase